MVKVTFAKKVIVLRSTSGREKACTDKKCTEKGNSEKRSPAT